MSISFKKFPSIIILLTITLLACLFTENKLESGIGAAKYEDSLVGERVFYAELEGCSFGIEHSRLEFRILSVKKNSQYIQIPHIKLMALVKNSLLDSVPQKGDLFWILGNIRQIPSSHIPGMVDWKAYYSIRQIMYEVQIQKIRKISIKEVGNFNLMRWSEELKNRLIRLLNAHLDNDRIRTIISAMIFGDKGKLEYDVKQIFSKSGVMHILAVSGLHVGIIYFFLKSLLEQIFRIKNRRLIIFPSVICCIWMYALITGLSPSVTRSTLMFSMLAVAELIRTKTYTYNIIFFSAFLILCVNPLKLFDLGFQLSYTAVLGIISIYPLFEKAWSFKNIILQKVWSLLAVSISAQLATIPLVLYYFHQFPTYFFLSNLIAIPLVSAIIPLTLLIMVLAVFSSLSLITGILSIILNKLVSWLYEMLNFISSWPEAIINISIQPWEILSLNIVLICSIGAMYSGKKVWLKISFIILFFHSSIICLIHIIYMNDTKLYLINKQNNLYIGVQSEGFHKVTSIWPNNADVKTVSKKIGDYWFYEGLKRPEFFKLNFNLEANYGLDFNIVGQEVLFLNMKDSAGYYPDLERLNPDVLIIKSRINKRLLNTIKKKEVKKIFGFCLSKNVNETLRTYCTSIGCTYEKLNYNDYKSINANSF